MSYKCSGDIVVRVELFFNQNQVASSYNASFK